jgi:hypothetical protein
MSASRKSRALPLTLLGGLTLSADNGLSHRHLDGGGRQRRKAALNLLLNLLEDSTAARVIASLGVASSAVVVRYFDPGS